MPNFRERSTAAPDTNILVLLMVAQTDLSLLRTFKRVKDFDSQDIDTLAGILKPFQALLTTPHVLAETSNFICQAPQYRRSELLPTFQQFIRANDELHEPGAMLAGRAEFTDLGLADTGLCSLSSKHTVITNDFGLAGKITALGGSVINFQQVRSGRIRPTM